MLECLLVVFVYSNSKFKITCKNANFECGTSGLTSKRNRPKIFYIIVAILLFHLKNSQLNGHPDYLGSATRVMKIIRCASKWFTSNLNRKSRAGLKCVAYA